MRIAHIVGRRNHGKTTLITELVQEYASRGLEVATAKHCGHAHELDTPGKDSYYHRLSGAVMSAVITPAMCAVYRPRPFGEDVYAQLRANVTDAVLLLVEGDLDGPGIKVEVWRDTVGGRPLALERDDIISVVTDDPISIGVPAWPRGDIKLLADRILCEATLLEGENETGFACPHYSNESMSHRIFG